MSNLYLNGKPLVWTTIDEVYDKKTKNCIWQLFIVKDNNSGKQLMLKEDADYHIKNNTIPPNYFSYVFIKSYKS